MAHEELFRITYFGPAYRTGRLVERYARSFGPAHRTGRFALATASRSPNLPAGKRGRVAWATYGDRTGPSTLLRTGFSTKLEERAE